MISESINILLIDDDELDRKAVLRQLKKSNLDEMITVAKTGDDGLEKIRHGNFDVVLLDYRLSNMTGINILDTLAREKILTMPVIMISGMDDESLMLKCLEHGAQDFLVKSEVNKKILMRAIRYAQERKNLQQQLISLAKYDSLTGLANRELFLNSLTKSINKAKRNSSQLAVLFIDIDHFKIINDSLGHSTGDELLKSIASRLQNSMRAEDMVARLGGDEFAILLDDIDNIDSIAKIAAKIIASLKPYHLCNNHELNVSPSIGISTFPECGIDTESLIQAADTAMYEVKRNGRNSFQFFSDSMQLLVSRKLNIENALRYAIIQNEFTIHYQPQIDAKTQRIVATEALIRWNNKNLGNVTPDEFIPIAEDSGHIKKLGAWVFVQACNTSIQWTEQQFNAQPLTISINVSIVQLKSDGFIDELKELLSQVSLPPKHIVLEITESIMTDDPDAMVTLLSNIQALGISIAIDDFGTGYSSLSYLRRLPIDILKIDQSFVADIGINKNGEAIVKTIITLAHNLGLEVIAEGVENQTQTDFLVNYECDTLQGYYFSRPIAADEITELLKSKATSPIYNINKRSITNDN
ncbi:MAG: EAL domain-containing protein [Gammaproteobacteria bacterium]|nr:EAL domain-containing protein [Gammaproteobacteria bacterium]